MLSQGTVRQLAARIVSGDDDSARARAINELSLGFLKSGDRTIQSLIAGFIRNGRVDNHLRAFAYFCLLDVSERTCDEYPNMKTFRFPDDVDWDFVDKASQASQEI